jgi:hypothetical protein
MPQKRWRLARGERMAGERNDNRIVARQHDIDADDLADGDPESRLEEVGEQRFQFSPRH